MKICTAIIWKVTASGLTSDRTSILWHLFYLTFHCILKVELRVLLFFKNNSNTELSPPSSVIMNILMMSWPYDYWMALHSPWNIRNTLRASDWHVGVVTEFEWTRTNVTGGEKSGVGDQIVTELSIPHNTIHVTSDQQLVLIRGSSFN